MDERLVRLIRTSVHEEDFAEQLRQAIATSAGTAREFKEFEGTWREVLNRARGGTPQIGTGADNDIVMISVSDLAALLQAVQSPTLGVALQNAGFRSSDRERIRVRQGGGREDLFRKDIQAERDGGHGVPKPGEPRMSRDKFFRFVRSREECWELIGGVPTRKPEIDGRSRNIIGNVLFAFWCQQDASGCRATALETAICTSPGNIRYPDVVVDCNKRPEPTTTIAGPMLVIELLSTPTPSFDARWKVYEYRQTPQIMYVLLIDTESSCALLHARHGERWDVKIYDGIGDLIEFPEIGTRLSLADVYEGVNF